MKTFQEFLEQTLPSRYTDYKAPPVQAAHARSMASASRLRQTNMNAIAANPEDDAKQNQKIMSGQEDGVIKPLPGSTSYSPLAQQLTGNGKIKVGDPGIIISR